MEEELWNAYEIPEKTSHSKIMMARGNSHVPMPWGELLLHLEELRTYARAADRPMIYKKLQELIPDYTPYFASENQISQHKESLSLSSKNHIAV